MKTTLLSSFALLTFVAAPAWAQDSLSGLSALHVTAEVKSDGQIHEAHSRYEQLADYYNNPSATAPTDEELSGWWTGRCFATASPSVATNSLLVGTERPAEDSGRDDGPLFPPSASERIVHVLANSSQGETCFDRLTESSIASIQNVLNQDRSYLTVAGPYADGSHGSTYDPGNLEYRVKKNGEYFIGRMTVIRPNSGLGAGDAYQYCYWFNKVR